jgi:hypothetical protein
MAKKTFVRIFYHILKAAGLFCKILTCMCNVFAHKSKKGSPGRLVPPEEPFFE